MQIRGSLLDCLMNAKLQSKCKGGYIPDSALCVCVIKREQERGSEKDKENRPHFVSVLIRTRSLNNYLPEHRVKICAIKLVRHPSRRDLRPQERHKLLKVHLAVS